VTIEHTCGTADIKISGPTDSDPHPGSATLTSYVWRDTLTSKIQVPTGGGRAFSLKGDGRAPVFENTIPACGFNVAIGGLGAQIALSGYIPGSPGGRATLSMHSLVRPGEDRHGALIQVRHKEECNKSKHHISNVGVFDGLAYAPARGEGIAQFYNKPTEVAGVELDPPLLNLRGIIGTRDGDSAQARKLARGESFSVASGPRTHEGADAQGSVKAATSMTVTFNSVAPRVGDCRNAGFVYAGTLDGRTRSEPSSNSSVVDSPPSGTRLRYTRTQQVNGQTWYYIEPSGRPPGWFSGEQASCTRPTNAPLPRIVIPPDEGMKRFNGRAAHAHAARG